MSSILSPPEFYILLSLAQKERHGYDIMKQVDADSDGEITLGPGTLYGAIKRMLVSELIVESAHEHEDTRRRYYLLTSKGKTALSLELNRFNTVVTLAKKKKLFDATAASSLPL